MRKKVKLEDVRGVEGVPIIRVSAVREGATTHMVERPQDIEKVFRMVIPEDTDREHFAVAMLDARHQVIGLNLVSMGTVSGSLVHPREVLKAAILIGASDIVVAHNHPTGAMNPSPEDLAVTRRLARAALTVGIELVDHLILGHDGKFYSMADHGQIN